MTVLQAVKKYDLEDFKKYYVDKSGKSMDLMPLDELKNIEVREITLDLPLKKAFLKLNIRIKK